VKITSGTQLKKLLIVGTHLHQWQGGLVNAIISEQIGEKKKKTN